MNSNVRQGRGIYVWPDGQLYEGFWEHNKASYRGRFITPRGGVYVGEVRDNMRHGLGVEIWDDGAHFEGHFYKNV